MNDRKYFPWETIHRKEIGKEHCINLDTKSGKLVNLLKLHLTMHNRNNLFNETLWECISPLLINHTQSLSHIRKELIHPSVSITCLDNHVTDIYFLSFAEIQFEEFMSAFLEAKRGCNHKINLVLRKKGHSYGPVQIRFILICLVLNQYIYFW